ncbi:glycosyltransferase [Immundisolibacter sp.]|uniref:glycosyltransferase n=1 Tax=Immundisolibacter sp. TaxID=1934948 RepID=UPI002603221C|nr:glycosyltransferase [Immundisolibacter sp.]MDD3650136.1 glycosyltransferase [Immundisolibacter sp.]
MARLAVFASSWPRGAIQRMMLNLTAEFAAAGHRVDLLAPRGRPPAEGLPDGVRLVELAPRLADLPGVRRHKRWFVPLALPALAAYLRHERPAALLSGGEWPNVIALAAKRLAGGSTRVVVSEHIHVGASTAGAAQRKRRRLLPRLMARLYPRADAIVAVSEGVRQDLLSRFPLPPARVHTIYNPVITPALLAARDEALDDPWFAPGAPPVLINVAQLRVQKDQATLLRAFAKVRARRPARLLILGEGNQRPALEALARELGIAADVRLPGFVRNPLAYLRRARLFVLSSAWEGLPTVLIEALACGCPVVSTDCPAGPAEILDHRRYGRLTPVGDADALAAAIEQSLDAPVEHRTLEGRAFDFSAVAAAPRYLELLWKCGKIPSMEFFSSPSRGTRPRDAP